MAETLTHSPAVPIPQTHIEASALRVNIGRAESDRGVPLDLQYLASLRDATPLAVSAIIAPVRAQPGTQAYNDAMKSRCQAAWTLLQRWQPNGRFNRSWTVWNLANARAREAVRDNEPVLRQIACEPTPPAFRPQPD